MISSRRMALGVFIGSLFTAGDAMANVEFSYDSNPLKWRYGYFNELTNYGSQVDPWPRFSFSFDVPESWLSTTSPSTFFIPVQQASTDPVLFETIDINPGAGGTLTVNPDGTVASWNFSMLLTELPVPHDPIYDVFDRRVRLSSAYGAGTCNCDILELKNTLFEYNGEYFEPLGPAAAWYRSRSTLGGWTGEISAVPEPATITMLLSGLLLLAMHGWHRRVRAGSRYEGYRLLST
jgi:hypothetical protein